MSSIAFAIHPDDNVATMLAAAQADEEVAVHGETKVRSLRASQGVPCWHKIALCDIAAGRDIVKFATTIGRSTADISAGSWVHLHNCRSMLDERSAGIDVATGNVNDTVYE